MAEKNSTLTQARLKELLHYDPETGIFTWIVKPSRRVCVGDVAGSEHGSGYRRISIDFKQYFSHRLAWFYVHGRWPDQVIDHRYGTPGNNALHNLRDVTRSVNQQNMRICNRDSKSGFLGVSRVPCGKFKAQIEVYGKRIFLGHHDTAEAAHAAYVNAKRLHHAGCTI